MNPILIIEDEVDIARLVEFQLNQSGFPVVTASDGISGLEQAKNCIPLLLSLI